MADEDAELVGELRRATSWSVLVRVLGRPEVVTPELVPVRFDKAKALELVAWLAEHAETATRSGARAALWELDVRDATFANVVSEARRALARAVPPPAGEEWIGRGQGERLPLHAGVRTDVDVVRRTARVCRDLPDHHAVPALRRVLELVRDVPYASSGYLWPDAGGRTSAAILAVTAAAADLATRLLDSDDVDGAFWATAQGLRVLPGHEELVCLRMEAHARRGDLAGVRSEYASYERVVLSDPWSDGTIAPKVSAARSRLLTAPRPAPASAAPPGDLVGSR
jgi:two-component SAPR family response regulator